MTPLPIFFVIVILGWVRYDWVHSNSQPNMINNKWRTSMDSPRSCLVPCPSWILSGPYNNTSITKFQVGQWWRKEKNPQRHKKWTKYGNFDYCIYIYIYIGFTRLSSGGCRSDFWIIPFKMMDLFFRGARIIYSLDCWERNSLVFFFKVHVTM